MTPSTECTSAGQDVVVVLDEHIEQVVGEAGGVAVVCDGEFEVKVQGLSHRPVLATCDGAVRR